MSVAVVTGVAGGIGASLAGRLAGDGHTVVAVDLADGVHDAVDLLRADGHDAVAVQADLTDPEGRERALDVASAHGPIDVLVNNAGITRDARLVKMEDAQFGAVIAVNLGAVYALSVEAVDQMVDGGSIVSISSRAYLGNFGQFNYSMSKGGVVGLTRALALDLAPRIRVNAIAPGLIETPMALAIPEDIRNRMVEANPMKRMGAPSDIAEAVAWLADGERSGYVTGHVLVIGGGRSLG
ncbi:MAG: SDR family oxidoreductase [Acidimicrobiia bacterium]|nr:SDR family oxidoreductase [Acidimicrobiia bacterium]